MLVKVWQGTVGLIGLSGGFALVWKIVCKIADYLSVWRQEFDLPSCTVQFILYVCVYDHREIKMIHLVCKLLTRIGLHRNKNWCMVENFNEILHNGEKISASLRSEVIKYFRSMLDSWCEMVEMISLVMLHVSWCWNISYVFNVSWIIVLQIKLGVLCSSNQTRDSWIKWIKIIVQCLWSYCLLKVSLDVIFGW